MEALVVMQEASHLLGRREASHKVVANEKLEAKSRSGVGSKKIRECRESHEPKYLELPGNVGRNTPQKTENASRRPIIFVVCRVGGRRGSHSLNPIRTLMPVVD